MNRYKTRKITNGKDGKKLCDISGRNCANGGCTSCNIIIFLLPLLRGGKQSTQVQRSCEDGFPWNDLRKLLNQHCDSASKLRPHSSFAKCSDGFPRIRKLNIQMRLKQKLLKRRIQMLDMLLHLIHTDRSQRLLELLAHDWKLPPAVKGRTFTHAAHVQSPIACSQVYGNDQRIASPTEALPSDPATTQPSQISMPFEDDEACQEAPSCSGKLTKASKEYDELFEATGSPTAVPTVTAVMRDVLVYTIPRYPDNHNPLLPRTLQKLLDEMSPREYLSYVLKKLTLEERESLMVDERQRRKTFLVSWPYENNLSGIRMAQCGFYSLDDCDRVQCVFCRGCLHKWEAEDNPMEEHSRSFNFCRFVKGLECGNREFRSDVLGSDDLRNVSFYREPEMQRNRDGSISMDTSRLGISTNRADTIRYAPEPSRMKTYSRWPPECPITSKRMCEAGFFYTGFDDQVRCFYCSGGIREWMESDDPWEEHARWFAGCSFLIQQKGEGYINQVHDRTPANKKCKRETVLQKQLKVEQRKQKSIQEAMVDCCLKLGHCEAAIRTALDINKGPFDSIRCLLNAVYDAEEAEISFESQDISLVSVSSLQHSTGRMVVAEEDLNRPPPDIAFRPGMMGGIDAGAEPPPQGCCRMCYRKTGAVTPANHIGLPCGHMILCETCNTEEVNRTANSPDYKPKCMYTGCVAPLTATFKIFFG